uniref:Oxysterol-binding protein n=1 Tax=Oncorhynchus tshawytscha TaxID=74940 RepID=A0A8C8H9A3_ONCTS
MEDLDPEDQFLRHARNGNLAGIQKLLMSKIKEEANLNINCKGKSKSNLGWTPLHLACYFGHRAVVEELLKAGADVNLPNNVGDTPLHKAAFTGRKEVVMLLLSYDACATVINGTAQIPKDVTQNGDIKNMLGAAERTEERKLEEELLDAAREGDLSTLSQLLNRKKPPDMNCSDLLGNTPLHCAAYRGQKLCALKLLKKGASPNIKNKNDQTVFDLANNTEIKQILESNIHKVSVLLCKKIIEVGLNRTLLLEKSSRFLGWRSYWVVLQDGVLSWYSKQLDAAANVRRQGCKPLTQAHCLIKARDNCFFTLKCFDDSVHHFKVSPKNDPEATRKRWMDAMEEHSAYSTHYCSQDQGSEEDEEEVLSVGELTESLQVKYQSTTCLSDSCYFICYTSNPMKRRSLYHKGRFKVNRAHGVTCVICTFTFYVCVCDVPHYRTSLPAPMFSRNDLSIWSILRKCIGMELSKITMPVIFNEPLSFLQRLTEYMEEMIWNTGLIIDLFIVNFLCVAAFAVSAVASQWERTGKPFNPLLGETYELVREDLGFRLISEQVSHHPPVSAFHAEGLKKDFVFHGSIYPKLKFWGKSVEAEPKGIITLELPRYNEAYTWTNPTCCVHNIIVGQLWIEQYGNLEVLNHKTGERCCLNFKPCGLFGKELHKVEGYILDKSKKKVCSLYGKWTECMYIVDSAALEAHKRSGKRAEEKKSCKQGSGEEVEEIPLPEADTVEVIPGSQLLWRIAPRPENSIEMYSFTSFAMQLNELDKDMEGLIPKTDCRLRPDIRAMENGDIDLASEEKKRLEEKQRAARKTRSKSDDEWKTKWFHQGQNPHNGYQDWLFSTGYWDRNYSLLPDIY